MMMMRMIMMMMMMMTIIMRMRMRMVMMMVPALSSWCYLPNRTSGALMLEHALRI
jgi:hypothetical protein